MPVVWQGLQMGFRSYLKPTRSALIGLCLILGFLGLMSWALLVPHWYESAGPLTIGQAKSHSPIALPSSAKNVRIATYHHWIAAVMYVRFEAPVSDCIAHAKLVNPGATEMPLVIDAFSRPSNPGFHDITPFDERGIKHGVTFGTGGPGEPSIAIDLDQGIFYYRLTD